MMTPMSFLHRRARVLAGVLASTPALVLVAAPRVVIAAPESSAPVRAELEVDAVALGEDGEVIAQRIRVRAEALLRSHEVLPARTAEDPHLRLEIGPLEGDDPGYRCKWTVLRAGKPVDGGTGASVCRLCTEDELLEHVDAAIERGISQLPPVSTTPVPAVGPTDPVAPTTDVPPRTVDDPPRPRRAPLGTLGKAGVGVLAVGVGALVPGIVLAVLPDKVGIVGGNELDKRTISTRIPGIALAAGGGAAIIAGAVLLAVDRKRARSQARLQVAPAWVRRGLGISIEGRF